VGKQSSGELEGARPASNQITSRQKNLRKQAFSDRSIFCGRQKCSAENAVKKVLSGLFCQAEDGAADRLRRPLLRRFFNSSSARPSDLPGRGASLPKKGCMTAQGAV
jgi:hypothetical protein